MITNRAAGIGHESVDHAQILATADAAAGDMARLVAGFLAGL